MIAFAEDRARWRPHSRYFAIARPNQQALFDVRYLPPGEHLVAAVDWVEDGCEEDPALLELFAYVRGAGPAKRRRAPHYYAPADGAGAIETSAGGSQRRAKSAAVTLELTRIAEMFVTA